MKWFEIRDDPFDPLPGTRTSLYRRRYETGCLVDKFVYPKTVERDFVFAPTNNRFGQPGVGVGVRFDAFAEFKNQARTPPDRTDYLCRNCAFRQKTKIRIAIAQMNQDRPHFTDADDAFYEDGVIFDKRDPTVRRRYGEAMTAAGANGDLSSIRSVEANFANKGSVLRTAYGYEFDPGKLDPKRLNVVPVPHPAKDKYSRQGCLYEMKDRPHFFIWEGEVMLACYRFRAFILPNGPLKRPPSNPLHKEMEFLFWADWSRRPLQVLMAQEGGDGKLRKVRKVSRGGGMVVEVIDMQDLRKRVRGGAAGFRWSFYGPRAKAIVGGVLAWVEK